MIKAVTWAVSVGRKLSSRTWAGLTFEVPRVVTGPFTVGREGTHCSAASTVCAPSTESLERALCQLLAAYSRLKVSATRSQIISQL